MIDHATNQAVSVSGPAEKLRKPRRIRLMARDMLIAGGVMAVVALAYVGMIVWLATNNAGGAMIGVLGGIGGAVMGLCGAAFGVIPAVRLRGLRARLRESRGWLCPECEYKLDPEPEGPCPECGWHATPERVKRTWQKLLRHDEQIDFAGAVQQAGGSESK